jgi:hypothetical protein
MRMFRSKSLHRHINRNHSRSFRPFAPFLLYVLRYLFPAASSPVSFSTSQPALIFASLSTSFLLSLRLVIKINFFVIEVAIQKAYFFAKNVLSMSKCLSLHLLSVRWVHKAFLATWETRRFNQLSIPSLSLSLSLIHRFFPRFMSHLDFNPALLRNAHRRSPLLASHL